MWVTPASLHTHTTWLAAAQKASLICCGPGFNVVTFPIGSFKQLPVERIEMGQHFKG